MIRPTKENVLVRVVLEPEKTESGLFLPPSAANTKPTQIGEVIATPKGFNPEQAGFDVGDPILFERFTTAEKLEINGVHHRIMPITDVIAKLEVS